MLLQRSLQRLTNGSGCEWNGRAATGDMPIRRRIDNADIKVDHPCSCSEGEIRFPEARAEARFAENRMSTEEPLQRLRNGISARVVPSGARALTETTVQTMKSMVVRAVAAVMETAVRTLGVGARRSPRRGEKQAQ